MGCRIERAAGLTTGALGCLCALQWLLRGIGGSASVPAAALLVAASLALAAGTHLHSRRGLRAGMVAIWAAAPVLIVGGVGASPPGLPLAMLAVFTPVLATLLGRGQSACSVRVPAPRSGIFDSGDGTLSKRVDELLAGFGE
jgi:hypothetical protein